jgi:hypothetical protein
MRKRTRVTLLLVALAAAAAALLLRLASPSSRINPDAYKRLKEGMTRAEVIAAIGGEPGDYRARPSSEDRHWQLASWGDPGWFRLVGEQFDELPAPHFDHWFGDDYEIDVVFDPQGRARYFSLVLIERHFKLPWFDRLKARVGR